MVHDNKELLRSLHWWSTVYKKVNGTNIYLLKIRLRCTRYRNVLAKQDEANSLKVQAREH